MSSSLNINKPNKKLIKKSNFNNQFLDYSNIWRIKKSWTKIIISLR